MNVELLNCLEEANTARAARNVAPKAEIARALAEGLHVVVEYFPTFCRSTDAYSGEGVALSSVHSSREAAAEALLRIPEDRHEDSRFVVLPEVEVPDAPAEPVDDSGVPF